MTEPKISVVVPIYGVEKYLAQCVESILAQTYKNLEIILVDDGSPDNCPAIVDKYAAMDGRVVAVHKPNGGYSSAVNHGLDIARGEYIAIVESDDWLEPDMYAHLMAAITETGADVVRAEYFNEFPDGTGVTDWLNVIRHDGPTCTIVECPRFLHFHPAIWSCLYRASLIQDNQIRFTDAPGAAWTDNLFQVQTLWYAKSIACLRVPLYHYRRRDRDGRSDLKNYNTPFDRTNEIHAWLRSQNISDAGVWACLYRREAAYVKQACLVARIGTARGTLRRIKQWIADLDMNIVRTSPYLARADKRLIRKFRRHPIIALIKYKKLKFPWVKRG